MPDPILFEIMMLIFSQGVKAHSFLSVENLALYHVTPDCPTCKNVTRLGIEHLEISSIPALASQKPDHEQLNELTYLREV